MYWDAKLETLNPAALQELQLSRLRQTVDLAAQSPFYGRRLKAAGVTAAGLRRLSDIRRIPFTTKDDLRTYGQEMLTRPLTDMVRLHASSGTTGQAAVIYYTRADIEAWADLVARSMYMAGMRATDVFQNMMGYGLFTGGLGFHYGAERLGALTIPIGAGNSQRQLQLMQQFATTAIHISPAMPCTCSTPCPPRPGPAGFAVAPGLSGGRAPPRRYAAAHRGRLRGGGLRVLRALRNERPRGGL